MTPPGPGAPDQGMGGGAADYIDKAAWEGRQNKTSVGADDQEVWHGLAMADRTTVLETGREPGDSDWQSCSGESEVPPTIVPPSTTIIIENGDEWEVVPSDHEEPLIPRRATDLTKVVKAAGKAADVHAKAKQGMEMTCIESTAAPGTGPQPGDRQMWYGARIERRRSEAAGSSSDPPSPEKPSPTRPARHTGLQAKGF